MQEAFPGNLLLYINCSGVVFIKRTAAIAAGGAAGAVSRYYLQHVHICGISSSVLTLMINVIGSFMLSFLIIAFVNAIKLSPAVRVGITTGFLGGFTTFSTFCKNTVTLFLAGNIVFGMVYAVFSIILGIAAASLGIYAAKSLEKRYKA